MNFVWKKFLPTVSLKRLGLLDFLGLVIVCVATFVRGSPAGDPGIGWHLQAGRWIMENRTVPYYDPFLFTSEGRAWIDDQWLSDLTFWILYRLGGWPLLHMFVIGLVLILCVAVLAPLVKDTSKAPLGSLWTMLLVTILISLQWFLRPVIFSFLLFAVVYWLTHEWYGNEAENSTATLKNPLLLGLLFCLWSNVHPAFVLGLVVLGSGALAAILNFSVPRKRRWQRGRKGLLNFSFAAVGTLFNPYGYHLHQSIFTLNKSLYFMNLNAEWLSVDFHESTFFPYLVSLIIVLLGFCRFKTSLNALDCVLLAFFLPFSIIYRRYIPFWAVVIAVPLGKIIAGIASDFEERQSTKSGILRSLIEAIHRISQKDHLASLFRYSCSMWLIFTAVAILQEHLPGKDPEYSAITITYPHQALSVLQTASPVGRVFHTPDWGGFFIWTLWPKAEVFLDDRNQLSSILTYEEFFKLNQARPGWQDIVEKYHFQWILLLPNSPLSILLEADPTWKQYFRDEKALLWKNTIFLRRTAMALSNNPHQDRGIRARNPASVDEIAH